MGAFIYVYACGGRARGRGVYLEGEDTPLGGGTHLVVGNYGQPERAKDRVNPRFRTHARRSHFHIYHKPQLVVVSSSAASPKDRFS